MKKVYNFETVWSQVHNILLSINMRINRGLRINKDSQREECVSNFGFKLNVFYGYHIPPCRNPDFQTF